MAKKQTFMGGVLNCRVPSKTRFGVELICRKNGINLTALVNRAVDDMLEREGLTSREPGQVFSLLDKIWDDSDVKRLIKMQDICPELLSSEDRGALDALRQVEEHNAAFGRDTPLTIEEMDRVVADFRAGDFP